MWNIFKSGIFLKEEHISKKGVKNAAAERAAHLSQQGFSIKSFNKERLDECLESVRTARRAHGIFNLIPGRTAGRMFHKTGPCTRQRILACSM